LSAAPLDADAALSCRASDACNLKSNQKNLGVIQCSNLCTEIVEYTAPDEVAVCNLASIALPKFVNSKTHTFDFERVRMPRGGGTRPTARAAALTEGGAAGAAGRDDSCMQ
jgi:hypothetical protein